MHIRRVVVAIIGALMVAGCAVEQPAGQASEPSLTETYWKLTELRGKAVTDFAREPHIILKREDGQVIGTGGCNGMGGTYELKKPNRIRFLRMMSTMMACAKGMETEQQLHKVLEETDSYTLANGTLQLNRARMAPLAKFVPVYLP